MFCLIFEINVSSVVKEIHSYKIIKIQPCKNTGSLAYSLSNYQSLIERPDGSRLAHTT